MRSVSKIGDFLKSEGVSRLIAPIAIGLAMLLLLSLIGSNERKSAEDKAAAEPTLAEMCSAIDGVGECKVMLTYGNDGDGRVTSAAVIYTGGGGLETERELKELISSLYGIGTNRIAVISAKR